MPTFQLILSQWLMLLPKKWNPRKQGQVYSWRFDPSEFGGARATPERPRAARRECGDDAMDDD